MVQFSTIFNALSKNISNRPGKKSSFDIGRETACELVKEAKKNELVFTSSGSGVSNNGKKTAVGYSKRGKKGINQDCFIVSEEFGCKEDMIFCGVFDGHGPWGHQVSKKLRKLMPKSLLCNWQETVALNSLNLDNNLGLEANEIQFDIWKESYLKTCAVVDQELQHNTAIDSFYSGSTAVSLVRTGDLMIIANVGDSRAVLATTSNNGSLLATQLTTDLKPNLPHESKRISESKGRIFSCPDEPGVYRVWMPKEGPGLALSRAFGDFYIKDFGLISEPEVTQRNINSEDQFVILATDGLWDVVSNQEAVEFVGSIQERAKAAKKLVEFAVSSWKRKGKADKMDDISVICLFFRCYSNFLPFDETKLNKTFV